MAAGVVSWNNLPSVILYEIFSYLTSKEKILASSTCHNWRFALNHSSFWKNVHFKMKSSDEDSECRIQYLSSCSSKKLHNATITFDSINILCIEQVAKVLENIVDNCNLKSLYLKPSNCTIDCPGESEKNKKQYFDRKFYLNLQTLVQQCYQLEHISFGCLEDFAAYTKPLLESLIKYQHSSIQTIGLATVKYDPDEYVLVDFDLGLLQNFEMLKIFSLDFDYVNDNLLSTLTQVKTLERLVIHVHGISDGHPGTTEDAWVKLTKNNPRCELRLSLIHSYDGVDLLHSLILRRSMPLTHIRVFFCEQLNCEALNMLSSYTNTLRSIWWVDSFNSAASNYLLGASDIHYPINPFVMCCWRCPGLEELVILGYRYYTEEVYAKTRLRQSLKRLDLAASDMVSFDNKRADQKTLEELEKEASRLLKQPWKTLSDNDLHSVILNPSAGDSDEFILPVVLQDLQ
uniref:F-box domain-containing protein n=1 Tax=Clastoptera arizonana TaxID=38151 RepID=A0A1B6C1Q6_9HEMI